MRARQAAPIRTLGTEPNQRSCVREEAHGCGTEQRERGPEWPCPRCVCPWHVEAPIFRDGYVRVVMQRPLFSHSVQRAHVQVTTLQSTNAALEAECASHKRRLEELQRQMVRLETEAGVWHAILLSVNQSPTSRVPFPCTRSGDCHCSCVPQNRSGSTGSTKRKKGVPEVVFLQLQDTIHNKTRVVHCLELAPRHNPLPD